MNETRLGKLEKINLKTVWDTEAQHFTPWLAQEDNLALLGETINLDLELEATEENVGPFRADILCKDTKDGSWVLIENQIGKTDHNHLGQLLTYAAGLNAVTIVWIAAPFTDEHRAALDWLNEITDEEFRFFGLEIELWRIGGSPAAPKFNIISKPNDWTKSVSRAATGLAEAALTETQRLQLEFWAALRGFMEDQPGKVKPTKALPQNWMTFAIGRTYFTLISFANTVDKRIGVYLQLWGPDAKPYFHLLHVAKDDIETAFGQKLEWRELPEKKESQVALYRYNADPADKADWPNQHAWIRDTLETFHEVFRDRLRQLDANKWAPSDEAQQESEE